MRMMGNTGMQVSVLAFGFWATFGAKDGLKDKEGIETAKNCLRVARASGINLFDNAEVYGNGDAEMIMGEAIKQLREEDPTNWRRSDIIVTTKIFWGGAGDNEKGLSAKHIKEGMAKSLKRLQEDYVDMVFCHRPDPFTPTETVVRAMTDIIRSGKAMTWGTSMWSGVQITEAHWIAKMQGLEPPQYEQPQYHMFERNKVEVEYHPLYQAPYHLGLTTWSPLASGLLTGKYSGGNVPDGSRLASPDYAFLRPLLEKWQKDGTLEKVDKLAEYAQGLGYTVGQLALAWSIRNANVTTTILGATKPEQLQENLVALNLAKLMTSEHDEAVEKILDNAPEAYQGWGGAGMRALKRMETQKQPVRTVNRMLPQAK
jgi:voltage-dependent potassium channel beta subunit